MKEKVLYVKLPEGAEYRRVTVTADGMIGIVYSEEDTNQSAISEANVQTEVMVGGTEVNHQIEVVIPKPEKLVGGTEVYQKDGIPYWFCKIKNGRDEFMHLYTADLELEDVLYDSKTGKRRKANTVRQQHLGDRLLDAVKHKPKEGYRWIPVFEPSSDGRGGVQYVRDEKPLVGVPFSEWEKLLKYYSPENESRKCSINTYFLQLLRWIKDGIVTFEELATTLKGLDVDSDTLDEEEKRQLIGVIRTKIGQIPVVENKKREAKNQEIQAKEEAFNEDVFNHFAEIFC